MTVRTIALALAVACSGVIAAPSTSAQNAPADRAAITWPPGYVEPNTPGLPYITPDTPAGTGPFKAIMASDPGAPEFVIYHPANLAALGTRTLPIVVWGNGSCSYIGNRFRYFLTEIASHGYLAVAGGPLGPKERETITMASNNPTPAVAAQLPTPPQQPRGLPGDPQQRRVTVDLLKQGITWAIAEHSRKGSRFFGKLDPNAVAVMGQSCGANLAANFGNDPRVKTVGVWMGSNVDARERFRVPVLYISGNETYDIMYPRARADFEAISGVPIFHAWRDGLTHLGTFRQQNGGELGRIAVAWLEWQLRGDERAARMFKGADCTLCRDAAWHVQKKGIDNGTAKGTR
jgi:dienelactone hydrolase